MALNRKSKAFPNNPDCLHFLYFKEKDTLGIKRAAAFSSVPFSTFYYTYGDIKTPLYNVEQNVQVHGQ